MGFDERKTLYSAERKVVGLKEGSAAEKAGLQNGDRILNNINMSKLRRDEKLRLKLEIRRGDQELVIEYLPHGDYADGFQWVRRNSLTRSKKSGINKLNRIMHDASSTKRIGKNFRETSALKDKSIPFQGNSSSDVCGMRAPGKNVRTLWDVIADEG